MRSRLLSILAILAQFSFANTSSGDTVNDSASVGNAAAVKSLSSFSPEEQARRREIIRKLSDPEYVQAQWVVSQVVSDNPLRDGFVPKGSDLRDFSIVYDKGRYHLFYIDIRHGKSSRRPDNMTFIGHASTPDFHALRDPPADAAHCARHLGRNARRFPARVSHCAEPAI